MMDDLTTVFFGTAFIAGIVEGSSVIRYNQQKYVELLPSDVGKKEQVRNSYPKFLSIKDSIIHFTKLTAYCILYGAASLPLGMIGASPGVTFLPCMPSISNKINSSLKQSIQQEISHMNTIDDVNSTTTQATKLTATGKGMGTMLRHENLKKIMQSSNTVNQISTQDYQSKLHIIQSNVADSLTPDRYVSSGAARTAHSLGLSDMVSTLDGSPLPTPLAEAMKRSRCLLIGAGLVSLALSRYLKTVNCYKVENSELLSRLEADESMASMSGSHFYHDSSYLKSFQYSHLKKLQKILMNGVTTAAYSIHLQLGRSLTLPPFSWLAQSNDDTLNNSDSLENSPIALRLVMNEEQLAYSSVSLFKISTFGSTFYPWLVATGSGDKIQSLSEKENSKHLQQQSPSFFVLPVLILGFHNHLKNHFPIQVMDYLTTNGQCMPYLTLNHNPKEWVKFPIKSSWLLKHTCDASSIKDAHSNSSTNCNCDQYPSTLVIEMNTCSSLYTAIRRRYNLRGRSSELDHSFVSSKIATIYARLLHTLVNERLSDDKRNDTHDNITTTSVLIHCEDDYDHDTHMNDGANQNNSSFIHIDALKVLIWAISTSINHMSLKSTFIESRSTQAQNDATGAKEITSVETIVSKAYFNRPNATNVSLSTENTTETSHDREGTMSWTVIEVLGTSIRHVLETSYGFASAVSFTTLKRKFQGIECPSRENPALDVDNSIPKVMHIVSSFDEVTCWIKSSLCMLAWEVKPLPLGRTNKIGTYEGTFLIIGHNDKETCELTCALIEKHPFLYHHPRTKIIIVLEDPRNYEMIASIIEQVCNDSDKVMKKNAQANMNAANVSILCTSFLYEFVFSMARCCLASGMSSLQVQLKLDRLFDQCTQKT